MSIDHALPYVFSAPRHKTCMAMQARRLASPPSAVLARYDGGCGISIGAVSPVKLIASPARSVSKSHGEMGAWVARVDCTAGVCGPHFSWRRLSLLVSFTGETRSHANRGGVSQSMAVSTEMAIACQPSAIPGGGSH